MDQYPEPEKDIDNLLVENMPSILRRVRDCAYAGSTVLGVEAAVEYATKGFDAGIHPTFGSVLFAGAGYLVGRVARTFDDSSQVSGN